MDEGAVACRMKTSGKDVHALIPGTWECDLIWRKGLAAETKFRVLRWGYSPGCPVSQCDHKGPSKRQAGGHSERRNVRMKLRSEKTEHALQLALKVEERATSQGMPVSSGDRRDEEAGGSSPRSSKRNAVLPTP